MSERTTFTDQKRHIATEADCKASWGGEKNGGRFRCYLCGHRFKPGDGFRWIATGGKYYTTDEGRKFGTINFKTCDACDGPDVIERWLDRNREFSSAKFWALR